PQRKGIRRFHDNISWLMQISLFLVLGLLVFPSHLPSVALAGLGVAAMLTFVARPTAVFLSLLISPFSVREKAFVAWGGLRGAVPIVLATYPLIARLPRADWIFNVVFFVVLVSSLVQGTSLPWVARRLRLA
ncbi:potassium/proton antiporter, partial [bacterium]